MAQITGPFCSSPVGSSLRNVTGSRCRNLLCLTWTPDSTQNLTVEAISQVYNPAFRSKYKGAYVWFRWFYYLVHRAICPITLSAKNRQDVHVFLTCLVSKNLGLSSVVTVLVGFRISGDLLDNFCTDSVSNGLHCAELWPKNPKRQRLFPCECALKC